MAIRGVDSFEERCECGAMIQVRPGWRVCPRCNWKEPIKCVNAELMTEIRKAGEYGFTPPAAYKPRPGSS